MRSWTDGVVLFGLLAFIVVCLFGALIALKKAGEVTERPAPIAAAHEATAPTDGLRCEAIIMQSGAVGVVIQGAP